ncbi:uncharacterized protein LOC111295766 isoform X2 [Durio zibethinus]|uniref:Uncharacterized protein LOC111295766 isoform X2 n=1 Tax=Durio zibethinus TaxID=66656 RepID=A0A6P5YXP2_DURZI|nr:uncharacterized protein LOC111295766 isoform X2 [Durio zibethinus]
MRPLFNSFPQQPKQFQSSSGVENQCSNNINMLMTQPQMGILNPQLPLLNNVGFMNGTNPLLPTQNNHLGFPQFGPIFPNLNNVSMFQQLPGQFNNPLQNPNQPNWLNLPQQSNMGLTNGQQRPQQQLFLQNQLQNMGQLLNVQIPNLSQFVSGGQTMGFLNHTVFPNMQFGFMQPNQMQLQADQSQQNLADVNASTPLSAVAAPQGLGNPSFRRPMGGPGKNSQNLNNFPGRNVKRDSKWGFQKSKFQQSRFHQADNEKRKFASSNGHKKKGQNNERASKFPPSISANSEKEKRRRSFALTYTEQEIQQWREQRKKYYPTKDNIKKKLSGKVADSEVTELRSEQLKEILAKQAELGVEVAEIPSHYLLGSEKKVNRREENSRPATKRGRFEMRHDKRGRFDKRDRFSKKQRSINEESFGGTSFNKRSPTLLQKLLSADIRKDKSRLLQVFRFMVINSFFKDWPEKPLKFPLVVVKDGLSEGEIVQEKPLPVGKDNIEVCNKTMIQSIVDGDSDHKTKDGNAGHDHGNHYENDDDIQNNNNNSVGGDGDKNDEAKFVGERADIGEEIVKNDEEEGEIID